MFNPEATSAMGGVLLGGAYAGAEATTGMNPLSVVPSPWMGALYGGFIFNPFKAVGAIRQGLGAGKEFTKGKWLYSKSDLFGRGGQVAPITKFKYSGMLGWKTMLLGVQDTSGVWARMSVGNIGLSATQLVGQAIQKMAPDWESPLLRSMVNARQLGLAGMMNVLEPHVRSASALKHSWLYKMAGIDVTQAKLGSLSGLGIKGKGLKITESLTKKGLQIAAKTGGERLFATAVGGFSLYSYLSLFSELTSFGGRVLAEGVGGAATKMYSWLDEVRKPEFGRGRVPIAMATQGAATERQRAIAASYKAKVAPTNRLYGTEAMYHHSR
jgi:hypothetical protein